MGFSPFQTHSLSGLVKVSAPTYGQENCEEELTILTRFEFDHHRMTMSVIVRTLSGERFVFVKGAFERIAQLCVPSTLPPDYNSVGEAHAFEGNYVLALAMRQLSENESAQTLSRDVVESGLEFVSLLLFRNCLKPDSQRAIAALRGGAVRTVMLTGDTAPTGAYIARECGLLDTSRRLLLGDVLDGVVTWREFGGKATGTSEAATFYSTATVEELTRDGKVELAITGACFGKLQQQSSGGILDALLLHTRIFARVSPTQKTDVVSLHMARGLVVGMCGDGGNDCGALRRAHVGLALSDAEASLVSPFTSGSKSCMSCVDLLREGRGALATSFASYKFLMQYGTAFSSIKLLSYRFRSLHHSPHDDGDNDNDDRVQNITTRMDFTLRC